MRWVLALVLSLGLVACSGSAPAEDERYGVLVFTRTAGFRHDSIPAGVEAFRAIGANNGFTVTATDDPAVFTADSLARFTVVVFLSTTGDVLDADQQAALQAYVEGGHGWVGVHSASDTEYDWPFYGQLVGARFARHPKVQPVTVTIEDPGHPATANLPRTWRITDEPYDFRTNPRADVRVLATLDESTYTGGRMGADHPIAWSRSVGSGRSFYVGLGHPAALYADLDFRLLLLGAVLYAGGT